MTINDTISNAYTKWMEGKGPYSKVVISSRVRLARNIAGYTFPHMQTPNTGQEVLKLVQEALQDDNVKAKLGNVIFTSLEELTPLDRQVLVEKHLISPQHADAEGPARGLILREDESVSVMVNEEDHLRIQVLYPALQLDAALDLASRVDDALESKLDFAFDEQYGYLTCCPTNVGTGLRASVMLHLPALTMTNQENRIFMTLSKLGFVVRGLYGEGTEAKGNLYQISNQITLGPSEEEIIGNLTAVTRQVVEQEESGREELRKEGMAQVEDMIYRSLGILANARIINADEAMAQLSNLRLGIDMGILTGVDITTLNALLVQTRPAFLQRQSGREMDAFSRDQKRASTIRETLSAAQ
jgi:protein arginine kinase